MRLLLVTGIYPTEIGGPATYAQKIAQKIGENGHEVAVLTYSTNAVESTDSNSKWTIIRIARGNKILNRIRFFAAVYRLAPRNDLVYMLDWFAAGFSAALACRARGVPYVVRVGGDYLWEQKYLESGKSPVPLDYFYLSGIYRKKRYALFYRIIRYVLRGAEHAIFNSDRQRELYIRYYGLSPVRVSTIYNPVPRAETPRGTLGYAEDSPRNDEFIGYAEDSPRNDEFIFWGRFIVMKNLTTLVRAFAAASLPSTFSLTLIGDGPRKKEIADLVRNLGLSERVKILPPMLLAKVLERGKNARAFILPSWTDISPNQVYECLAIGLPVLVTKENYLSIKSQLPETINPNSVSDISEKLESLANDDFYRDFAGRFNAISFEHYWDQVVAEHQRIFEGVSTAKKNGTHVLQIGSDRTIFDTDSQSASRMKAYGKCFGSLDMIIFSRRVRDKKVELAPSVTAYATNSFSRAFYVFRAIYLGLRLPRPDVISVQDPFESGLSGAVISILRGVPLHVQIHTDFLSPEFSKFSILNRIRVFLAHIVLRRAARIRVVSNRIRDSLRTKNYKLKTVPTVLPIFVDVAWFGVTQASSALLARDNLFDYKFLVVSRLETEKNVGLAIAAFARAAIEKSCLIIIGDGSQLGRLREFAEKKGVGRWIFFEGQTDPAPYYKIADLVLFPSKYEGYGMVIVEALAAGTPVLSTDVGIAREAGAIVASPKEFPEAIKNWVKNGPREGHLKNYPYKNFKEYVRAYCDDISSCVRRK